MISKRLGWLGAAALLMGFSGLVVVELFRPKTIIDGFEVAGALQDLGYSSRFVASRLEDELFDLSPSPVTSDSYGGAEAPDVSADLSNGPRRAKRTKQSSVSGFSSGIETVNLELPFTKVPLSAIVQYLQRVMHIGKAPAIVSGGLTKDGSTVKLLTRVSTGFSDQGQRAFQEFPGTISTIDATFRSAAAFVLQQVDPLTYAFHLLDTGAPDEAEATIREYLITSHEPDVGQAHNLLAIIRYNQGRLAAAVDEATLAVAAGSDVAHINIGRAWAAQGELDLAERHYALAGSIRRAVALNNIASIRVTQGRHAEALGLFEAAWKLSPDEPVYVKNLGAQLIRAGRVDEGMRYLRALVRRWPEDDVGVAELAWQLTWQGQGAQVWPLLVSTNSARDLRRRFQRWGERLRAEGRAEDAERLYTAAHARLPEATELSLRLGELQTERGRFSEARAALEEARRHQKPGEVGVDIAIAWTCFQQGDYDAAESAIGRAASVTLNNPEVHVLRAWILGQTKGGDVEFALLQEAVRVWPDSYYAQRSYAISSENRNRPSEALQAYEKASRISPWSSEIHADIGDVLLAQGNQRDSRESYGRALRIDSEFSRALLGMAKLDIHALQLASAEDRLMKILTREPYHLDALLYLGNVYKLRNDCRRATVFYRTAREKALRPVVSLLNNLASCLESENPADAVSMYREALASEPNNPDALAGLKRLGSGG